MRAIFISYRRGDAEGHAQRLYDELAQRFGESALLMGASGLEPSEDLRHAVDEQVASCSVLLAVLGAGWLAAEDAAGQRRLDHPLDPVRLEVGAALRHDEPLVPLLVQGARMPHPEELPAELGELAFQNPIELTEAHWDSDVAVLIRVLSRHVPLTDLGFERAAPARDGRGRWVASATAALGVALLGLGGLAYGINRREAASIGTAVAPLAAAAASGRGSTTPHPSVAAPGPGTRLPTPARVEAAAPARTLFNYWSAEREDNLLSTTAGWSGVVDDPRGAAPVYRLSAIEGAIFDANEPQPRGTLPLVSWFSEDLRYNRATTDASWRGEAYDRQRLEGYVYDPAAEQPPGTRPLFSWYSVARDDYFTTAQAHWCVPIGTVRCAGGRKNDGPSRDGYALVRLEGFVR